MWINSGNKPEYHTSFSTISEWLLFEFQIKKYNEINLTGISSVLRDESFGDADQVAENAIC